MFPLNKSLHIQYYFQTLPISPIQVIHPTLLMQAISSLYNTFKSNDRNKDVYC